MKLIFFSIAILGTIHCISQESKKIEFFLSFQANKTIYDRTASNNAQGIGLGLQTVFNTKSILKPVIELNGDLFAGTKELYITDDGKPIHGKGFVLGIHAGPMMRISESVSVGATLGSHFYNGNAHFSARPSVTIFPGKNKKWTLLPSFTNVFQMDNISNEHFGYASFALAWRII